MNDRSSLKTDIYRTKRKLEEYPMNSSEKDNFFEEVNAKKGKSITREELGKLVEQIRKRPGDDGSKCYMLPMDYWNNLLICYKKGMIEEIQRMSKDDLYQDGSMKKGLVLDVDYKLIPENVFLKLRNAFGVVDGHEMPIHRPWLMVRQEERSDPEPVEKDQPMEVEGKRPADPRISREELEQLVALTESQPLNLGDKWFIVPQKWWMDIIRMSRGEIVGEVGPICNEEIVHENGKMWSMKPGLLEGVDFVFLPEKVFRRLRAVFGIVRVARDCCRRDVVPKGNSLVLLAYPRNIHVFLARCRKVYANFALTGEETLEEVGKMVLQRLNLDRVISTNLRFYITPWDGEEHWELLDLTQGNVDTYFDTAQKVAIDIKDEEGNWLFEPKTYMTDSVSMTIYAMAAVLPGTPGTCGLHNLGNTCFMASAIQCLSNIPSLTDYFVAGQYMNDLNDRNPLGTQGELVQSYADLIRTLWRHEFRAFAPRRLKATIGQFAPRFSGYNQQDSQELLAYLLDGLHEDLNRIRDKPYLQEEEDLDQLEEHEAAKRAWAYYKSRNDSIIVDKFHGQLKSRLVCPTCHKVSIKFDPFCFLSVPVPAGKNVPKISVTLIYNSVPKKKWAKFAMTLTAGMATVKDVLNCVNENLQHTNSQVEGCMFSVGICSDNVRILDPSECVIGDEVPKSVYLAQLDHKDPQRKYAIIKNQSQQGRPLSLPMVFSYLEITDLSEAFLKEKVIPFFHATYHNTDTEVSDDAYSVFVDTGDRQYPYPEHLDEPPADQYVTLIVVWKTPSIFNNYRGDLLIEREVSLHKVRDVHLLDCIDLFTREEQLDEQDSWYCPVCREHKRATKKLDLWSLPEVLIIHLKRFHYGRYTREKIEDPVYIPVRDFELNDKLANEKHEHVKYDLIACSNHMGGLGGGHYTACAKNRDGKWYEFNDAMVTNVFAPSDPWLDRNAYVLIYQKKAIIPDAAHTDHNLEMEID